MNLEKNIRSIPDFPIKGIDFKDITTLLKDRNAFKETIKAFSKLIDEKIDIVIGIEARGFIFGSALAYEIGAGFVPIRKPGKLPFKTISYKYSLEYGEDKLEIHEDAIENGQNVLIVDDLLATGGTSLASINLVQKLGGKVSGCFFLIELEELAGRKKLEGIRVESLIKY